MDEQAAIEWLRRLRALPRRHANGFYGPDKRINELMIAHDMWVKLEAIGDGRIKFIEYGEDPPDTVITTFDDQRIALELTELVSREAIEEDIKSRDMQRSDEQRHRHRQNYLEAMLGWDQDKTRNAVTELIDIKNTVMGRVRGDYAESALLIYTDEHRLNAATMAAYLNGYLPPDAPALDQIYVMTGYDPRDKGVSLFRIK